MNLLHGIVSRAPVLCIYKPHPSPLYTGQFLNRNILRRHAIFRDTTHHSLSQSLDTRRSEVNPRDTVGPFTLGVPPTVSNGKKVPKWSELNTTGKVIRTTARTTNLGVILLGAGLSTLLIYSLTSELFSKNSPTVLYGDACEKIKTSLKVARYLHAPLTFHNNPPSAIRPRHRNRHVTSQIFVDSYGNEHMIMTFYVKGSPPSSMSPIDASYLESVANHGQEIWNSLSGSSLQDSVDWMRYTTEDLWNRARDAFKYVSGTPISSSPTNSSFQEEQQRQATKGASQPDERSVWNFAGIFKSLRGSKSGGGSEDVYTEDGRLFTEGEVHADLVRNSEGYFTFRYLLIDIPSTRDRNPLRVFVERGSGVRENEPVMRWNS